MSDATIDTFLKEEVIRIQAATKRTRIIGGVVALIVFGYMAFLSWAVNSLFLEPQTLAGWMGTQVQNVIPSFLQTMEDDLIQKAPATAITVRDETIKLMPQLRAKAEEHVDTTISEVLPQFALETEQTIRDYIRGNSEEIVAYYEGLEGEEINDKIVRDLIAEILSRIDAQLRAEGQQDGKNVLAYGSLHILNDINDELGRLVSLDPDKMSEEDRLQRRMIVSWAQTLNEARHRQAIGDTGYEGLEN